MLVLRSRSRRRRVKGLLLDSQRAIIITIIITITIIVVVVVVSAVPALALEGCYCSIVAKLLSFTSCTSSVCVCARNEAREST